MAIGPRWRWQTGSGPVPSNIAITGSGVEGGAARFFAAGSTAQVTSAPFRSVRPVSRVRHLTHRSERVVCVATCCPFAPPML